MKITLFSFSAGFVIFLSGTCRVALPFLLWRRLASLTISGAYSEKQHLKARKSYDYLSKIIKTKMKNEKCEVQKSNSAELRFK